MYKKLVVIAVSWFFSWIVLGETPQVNQEAGQIEDRGIEASIQVHGHWKLEVFDPDGTLVKEVEFENALNNSAAFELSSLIGGTEVSGGLYVSFGGIATGPCDEAGTSVPCTIKSPDLYLSGTVHSDNLQVIQSGTLFEITTLTGSSSTTNNSSITNVYTHFKRCSSNVSSTTCKTTTTGFTGVIFTNKTLPSPVSVTAGQIVQVTVTLTFS